VDINPRTVPTLLDPPVYSLEVASYSTVALYGIYRGTPLGQFEGAFLRDGAVCQSVSCGHLSGRGLSPAGGRGIPLMCGSEPVVVQNKPRRSTCRLVHVSRLWPTFEDLR
jgi:hypothetical protein